MSGAAMQFSYDEGNDGSGQHCNVKRMLVAWTSDSATGAVDSATAALSTVDAGVGTGSNVAARKIVGRIIKIQTVPGAGGVQPTNNYTVTVKDSQGIDIAASCDKNLSANQSNAAAQETYLLLKSYDGTPLAVAQHPVVCDVLEIAVSGAGNSKQGTIIIFWQPLG